MFYELNHDAERRTSTVNVDRYARRSSLTIEHGLVLRDNATLPVHKTKNGNSWAECIFQLFFSIQGPLFFILPGYFRDVGYLVGIVGCIAVGLFYVYLMQMYLRCESEVRQRYHIANETNLSIYSLVDLVVTGSDAMNRLAKYLNAYLKYEIILSWGFGLSFNEVFICANIKLMLRYFGYTASDRFILACLFLPTTVLALVPDLKVMSYLAYCSTLLIVVLMFAAMYLMAVDPIPPATVVMVSDVSQLPVFVAVVLLSVNCTPLIFSFKQEMKKKEQFGSFFGSLNTSIIIFIALNVCFSLFTYCKYGNATQQSLIEDLPQNLTVTLVNGLLTVAILASSAVSFFVIFETIWCGDLLACVTKSRNRRFYEFMARTSINLVITTIAIVIPTLSIFISLISCFSYPFDMICLPVVLQSVLMWKEGERDFWFFVVAAKNAVLLVIGFAFSTTMLFYCVSQLSSFYGA